VREVAAKDADDPEVQIMAEENHNMAAGEGTGSSNPTGDSISGCPTWDNLGGGTELPPFFSPREELKRQGFTVKFLTDKPRKETPSAFDSRSMELWFDIQYQGRLMTWTISQISLLLELKKLAPLKGKEFFIQLVPVDEEFKRARPQFRGKDRYLVKSAGFNDLVTLTSPPLVETSNGE